MESSTTCRRRKADRGASRMTHGYNTLHTWWQCQKKKLAGSREGGYSWMSQISARNGGSFLFCTLSEKHISAFMLPRVRSSVKMDSSRAK